MASLTPTFFTVGLSYFMDLLACVCLQCVCVCVCLCGEGALLSSLFVVSSLSFSVDVGH